MHHPERTGKKVCGLAIPHPDGVCEGGVMDGTMEIYERGQEPTIFTILIMNDKTIVGGIAVLILIVAGVLFMTTGGAAPKAATAPDGALALAQCMAEKGTTFYGAFWCPHCQKQKKLFGSAAKELPYVECSTADGKGQLQVCIDKGVKSYPTWEFGDGSRLTGELSFDTLREKSGCALPGTPLATSTDEHAGHDMTTTTPVLESPLR